MPLARTTTSVAWLTTLFNSPWPTSRSTLAVRTIRLPRSTRRTSAPALPAAAAGSLAPDLVAAAARSCSVATESAAGATWASDPPPPPPPAAPSPPPSAEHPAATTSATSATPTAARRSRMPPSRCRCLLDGTAPAAERFLAPSPPGAVDGRLPGRAGIWKPPAGLHRSPRSPARGRRHLPTPTRQPRHPVAAGRGARPVRRLGRRRARLSGGVVTRAGAGVRQHHPGGGH